LKYIASPTILLKIAVLFGAAFVAVCGAQAQEIKVGYIDQQRIISEGQPFKLASAKLEQDFSKRNKELQDMAARLKAMQEKLEKEAPVLAESERNKRQRELIDLSREGQRRQREFQEDYGQRRNEDYSIVLERVNKVINQIAEAEKYDLVIQDAVYHSTRVDITDKVLKVLNKQ